MRKQRIAQLILSLLFTASISPAIAQGEAQLVPVSQGQIFPADKDTAHYQGSGIRTIPLTPEKIDRLATLGALWGFIKYYHSGVQGGNHNMDAVLLRFLPMILAARDDAQAVEFMERWVDMFGRPAECRECSSLNDATGVVLKPDLSLLFEKGKLPASLVGKLEYLRANRFPGGRRHYYIDMAKGVGNPVFSNEYAYADQQYPDAGLRLLSLYRYWNMIQYFFPYRHLIGEDWNKVLAASIPEFCSAPDTAAYQLACLKLVARINDGHANLGGGASKLPELQGKFITPFRARFVEGKLVVTGYYDSLEIKSKIVPGDVIDSIDGVAVAELVKRYLPLTPGSNIEARLWHMAGVRGFLLRSNEAAAIISLSGKRRVEVARIPAERFAQKREPYGGRYEGAYKLLDGNIAYLFPARFTASTIDTLKELFGETRGLVIDLRCYPTTFMPFTYGEWLKPAASSFARFTAGSTDIPGLFTLTEAVVNGKENRSAYRGKVVIIVNEQTQSQAEYTAMALQTVPGAITVGSTTAGADGNVSEIVLPGGLRTMISGIGVLYPDGTETQRKGVKIDRVARPTIKGIREGRDEPLEAALKAVR